MAVMAGELPSQIKLNNIDSFHPASEFIPIDPLPKIYNNCDSDNPEQCELKTLTISENYYYSDGNEFKIGREWQSAWEIKTKMMSRQSIHIAINSQQTSFDELDV